jgi:hypothetical protein
MGKSPMKELRWGADKFGRYGRLRPRRSPPAQILAAFAILVTAMSTTDSDLQQLSAISREKMLGASLEVQGMGQDKTMEATQGGP